MGIHSHSRDPISIGQEKSGCFSSHSCQLQHLLQLIRHLSAILAYDLFAAFFNILRLVFIQPYRADIRLNFFRRRLCHSLYGRKMPEKIRQRFFHLLIRTLCTEHNRCQQLPVMIMIETILCCPISFIQHI